jgi:hypothetical protein
MNLDILNAVVRDLLISEGKYHQYKNKVFKSKKDYKRKDKHKKKTLDN